MSYLHPLCAWGILACSVAFGQKTAKPAVPQSLDATVERAALILVACQESMDGAEAPNEWPYEGVYRERGEIPMGYRVGGTAISAWSLIETPAYQANSEVRQAVARALDFVLTGLDHERMASGFRGTYDVRGWGHTYALIFLLRLRERELVPEPLASQVKGKIEWLVQTLGETEIPGDGGWGYARRAGFSEPSPASPFMTAPTLMALFEAASQGEEVNGELLERALNGLEDSRTEAGFFPYSSSGGRDEAPGAIGRSPAAEVTLFLAGRSSVEDIRDSLDAFLEHWEWLEKRRRQTGTHVPPYGIAPYYFFYAHNYAGLAIEFLDKDARPRYRARFLERLFQVQENSGGWNDRVFPRSENFGTAMSVLALLQPKLPTPAEWDSE